MSRYLHYDKDKNGALDARYKSKNSKIQKAARYLICCTEFQPRCISNNVFFTCLL